MRHIILILSFVLVTSIASAESWIKFDPTTKRVLRTVNGDGTIVGCSGINNSNISSNCILATATEYQNAKLPLKKVNTSVVVGSRVIDLTTAEKSAITAAKATAQLTADRATADRLAHPTQEIIAALVKRLNIRFAGNPITKQEIIDQLKTDKGL